MTPGAWLAVAALVLLGAPGGAAAQRVWLVIGASDPSPAGIARKAKEAAQGRGHGLVFNTRDCGDAKSVFGWAAEIAETAAAARAARARAQRVFRNAYLKACDVRPGSLLSIRYPAVDPSVADVPDDAVNWSDDDRVSSASSMSGGRVAVIARYYAPVPDDAREGRRARLVLGATSAAPITLMDPCLGAGGIVERGGRIAFHCVTEQAADRDLHTTFVVDRAAKRIAQIPRCSNPRWIGEQELKCSEESIQSDGLLLTRPKQTRIPDPAGATQNRGQRSSASSGSSSELSHTRPAPSSTLK